jgi:hypothetical protein
MTVSYRVRRQIKAARNRGRLMAQRRWQLDRERRNRLLALSPENYPGRILRRIVVIDNEMLVRETVIYESDSIRESRRKVRRVMEFSGDGMTKKCPNTFESVQTRPI